MATLLTSTDLAGTPHRGKVRDTYDLGDSLLMVTTDRISAFDVVLPTGIPEKGVVLSEMSAFWFKQTSNLLPNHLLCMAYENDKIQELGISLPTIDHETARRGMIIKKAERIDVECIARGYITGSAWAEYTKSGTVNGTPMPAGLKDSQAFETPLFTPTTKAEEGHDMPMSYQELVDMVGTDTAKQLETMTIDAYAWANDFANKRGIILADTKFEFGWINGELSIIDEMLTPDSSRFWDLSIYKPGQPQPSFDKQYVRDWLSDAGWDKEPPAPGLPDEVVNKTSATYLDVFEKLTGLTLST